MQFATRGSWDSRNRKWPLIFADLSTGVKLLIGKGDVHLSLAQYAKIGFTYNFSKHYLETFPKVKKQITRAILQKSVLFW